jgi:hypothetical protein
LELDVDEIPDPVLHELLRFVKTHRKAIGADIQEDDDYEDAEEPAKAAPSGGRKKNKPMTAREQEERIQQLHQQLSQFNGGSRPQGEFLTYCPQTARC